MTIDDDEKLGAAMRAAALAEAAGAEASEKPRYPMRYRIELQLWRDDQPEDKPEVVLLADYFDEDAILPPLPTKGDCVGFGGSDGNPTFPVPKHAGVVTYLTYNYDAEAGLCYIIINANRIDANRIAQPNRLN